MFKKSSKPGQLNIFTSHKSLFSGKSLKMFEDMKDWHNQFRKQVTIRTDEYIFRSLSFQNNIISNDAIRIIVAMMIFKETKGLSNQKIFGTLHKKILMGTYF